MNNTERNQLASRESGNRKGRRRKARQWKMEARSARAPLFCREHETKESENTSAKQESERRRRE